MLFSRIPNHMNIDCPPLSGTYSKQRMRGQDLYCWFRSKNRDAYPHISIVDTSSYSAGEVEDFHVTFPLVISRRSTGGFEKASHSLYYKFEDSKMVYVKTKSALPD